MSAAVRYKDHVDRLVSVENHTGIMGLKIGDLIPPNVIDRIYQSAETEFVDVLQAGSAIPGQIKA